MQKQHSNVMKQYKSQVRGVLMKTVTTVYWTGNEFTMQQTSINVLKV